MNDEEVPQRIHESETRAMMELRQKAGLADVLYPEDPDRKRKLINFVARLLGPIPDAYDAIAAGVALEYIDATHEAREFQWNKAVDHPAIRAMLELTVSLGGGKGRKEGVELGKSNPPMQQKERWGFRRGSGR